MAGCYASSLHTSNLEGIIKVHSCQDFLPGSERPGVHKNDPKTYIFNLVQAVCRQGRYSLAQFELCLVCSSSRVAKNAISLRRASMRHGAERKPTKLDTWTKEGTRTTLRSWPPSRAANSPSPPCRNARHCRKENLSCWVGWCRNARIQYQ